MDETILSWNVPNIITVCCMALIGFAIWQVVKRSVPTNKAAQ